MNHKRIFPFVFHPHCKHTKVEDCSTSTQHGSWNSIVWINNLVLVPSLSVSSSFHVYVSILIETKKTEDKVKTANLFNEFSRFHDYTSLLSSFLWFHFYKISGVWPSSRSFLIFVESQCHKFLQVEPWHIVRIFLILGQFWALIFLEKVCSSYWKKCVPFWSLKLLSSFYLFPI